MPETSHPLIAFAAVMILGAPLLVALGWRMRPRLAGVLPALPVRELRPSAHSIVPPLAQDRPATAPSATRSLLGLAAHVASWGAPLLVASLPPFLIARSASLPGVIASQRDLWFVLPQPLAFAIFVAALGIGVRCAPAVEIVPPIVRRAVRAALLLGLGILGGALFLGGELGETFPAWTWLLAKGAVVAFLAHKVGGLAVEQSPAALLRGGWAVALPLALLDVAVLGAFAWLEGYVS